MRLLHSCCMVNNMRFSVITTTLAYLHITVMALFPVLICTFVTLSISTSSEEEVGGCPQSGQHKNWKWVTVKGALACAYVRDRMNMILNFIPYFLDLKSHR